MIEHGREVHIMLSHIGHAGIVWIGAVSVMHIDGGKQAVSRDLVKHLLHQAGGISVRQIGTRPAAIEIDLSRQKTFIRLCSCHVADE